MAQQQQFDPAATAKSNVDAAVDQHQSYPSLAHALDAYYDNLLDTLIELHVSETDQVLAIEEFKALAGKQLAGWYYCISAEVI
jgi:hypothetical protein